MSTKKATKSGSFKLGTIGWFLLGIAGAVLVGYFVRKNSKPGQLQRFAGMGAGPTSKSGDASRKLEPNWHGGRDAVEEASWESFPASDPPSF